MIVTNIEYIPNMQITEQYGVVAGSTVRSKNAIKDIGASFKNFVGGELKAYTQLLDESRKHAIERMIHQAEALGANAIINVRFATSSIAAGAAEVYVYVRP
ncbi:MAG: YbjQ family protein [Elusimicrobiota bacterium]|nr:YbjQ family protein [Elusimicrobiota bacterium]